MRDPTEIVGFLEILENNPTTEDRSHFRAIERCDLSELSASSSASLSVAAIFGKEDRHRVVCKFGRSS